MRTALRIVLGVAVTVAAASADFRGQPTVVDIRSLERGRILPAADRFLKEQPITITATRSPRSAGGLHDFFSEADYWWPDPKDPGGPYIQRDGMTNPDNFVEHRREMIRFATQVATWTTLNASPTTEEVIRNLPIRHPVLWID